MEDEEELTEKRRRRSTQEKGGRLHRKKRRSTQERGGGAPRKEEEVARHQKIYPPTETTYSLTLNPYLLENVLHGLISPQTEYTSANTPRQAS